MSQIDHKYDSDISQTSRNTIDGCDDEDRFDCALRTSLVVLYGAHGDQSNRAICHVVQHCDSVL